MSSSLFAITAQSNTGSDWNWFLIFIIFVVILVIALMVQAMFSKKDADEFEFHEAEAHPETPETQPAKPQTAPAVPAQPKPAPKPAPVLEPKPEPEAKPGPAPEVDSLAPDPDPVPEKPIKPDDLKKIEGIGPKVASLLNENGITTFAQLAVAPVEKLDEILDANKLQMMDPGSWPQQAQLAAEDDWAALEKLQDKLKGGR